MSSRCSAENFGNLGQGQLEVVQPDEQTDLLSGSCNRKGLGKDLAAPAQTLLELISAAMAEPTCLSRPFKSSIAVGPRTLRHRLAYRNLAKSVYVPRSG